jgi:hypothetical protein
MLTSSVFKQKERAELNRLVNDFLAKGGQIQIIPMGVKGECKPLETPKLNPKKQLPRGVRCRICDWSLTNSQSLCNPEIAEYGGNRLEIDDLTGDMLCRACLSQAASMNRPFKTVEDLNYGLSSYMVEDALDELDGVMLTDDGPGAGWRPVYDPIMNQVSPGSYRKGHAEQQSS